MLEETAELKKHENHRKNKNDTQFFVQTPQRPSKRRL